MMDKMDCTDIKALLSALVDDEIDEASRHRAERHLVGCEACRSLITEAEALDETIAAEARGLEPAGLPSGFEGAVLARTVYDRRRWPITERWATWLGWLAAAASIALAAMIWMIDRPTRIDRSTATGAVEMTMATPVVYGPGPELKSSIFKGTPASSRVTRPAPTSARLPMVLELSREDGETMFAASNVLELLAAADLNSFADVERIRRIVEYDELLPRLAMARDRVSDADRPVILATESILTRIVRGPINAEDLEILRETSDRLELASAAATMSDRSESSAI